MPEDDEEGDGGFAVTEEFAEGHDSFGGGSFGAFDYAWASKGLGSRFSEHVVGGRGDDEKQDSSSDDVAVEEISSQRRVHEGGSEAPHPEGDVDRHGDVGVDLVYGFRVLLGCDGIDNRLMEEGSCSKYKSEKHCERNEEPRLDGILNETEESEGDDLNVGSSKEDAATTEAMDEAVEEDPHDKCRERVDCEDKACPLKGDVLALDLFLESGVVVGVSVVDQESAYTYKETTEGVTAETHNQDHFNYQLLPLKISLISFQRGVRFRRIASADSRSSWSK